MEKNIPFTKFSVEQKDQKVTVEYAGEDVNLNDCITAVVTLLAGLTFSPRSIYESFKDYVEDHKFLYENDEQD